VFRNKLCAQLDEMLMIFGSPVKGFFKFEKKRTVSWDKS